ncbi:hypothetical protein B5807_11776 [Epicoccum nigrum]|uniref:RING-type domain-containing protein n=1 Tax=Epicoccum nigrum TaxID=105696 RepID=A0A1Y2LIL8_EPING|nr:hypothetical protein B5807_11776 [Epicoccum nigrum]
MPSQTRQKTEVVIARSKRTGKTYHVRTAHLSGHHAGQSQPPRADSFVKSISTQRLHYLSKNKDKVCRCSSPDHASYKRVQNTAIQGLCAEYFFTETNETTCTRDQWRATMQEAMRTEHLDTTAGASEYTHHRSDSFEYDSNSTADLLQAQEAKLAVFGEECSRVSFDEKEPSAWPKSSKSDEFLQAQEARLGASCGKHRSQASFDEKKASFALPKSSGSDHEMYLRSGPCGEADVPEEMWRDSRPSVYLEQYHTDSVVSTPIGSSVSQVYEKTHSRRGNSLSILGLGTKAPGIRQRSEASYDVGPGIAGLNVNSTESTRPSPTVWPTDLAELPILKPGIERAASSIYSPYLPHHSLTLRELEGGSFSYVAEMACRSTLLQEENESRRLTKLVSQPLESPNLPSQEDFFLNHISPCSRTHPAPIGDCTLCQTPFNTRNKHTILLPCTHHIHQECLLSRFRTQDFEFGNCPLCGMALCERTLHDRIETDRVAIFGAAFTPLLSGHEERIEFPAHSQTITCRCEEEVAAAQLRLLKDYIDSHADELYRLWSVKAGAEPDWHGQVIVPVVSLFKGWNVPKRQCKYFAGRDAFYKVVAWAELVRLMGTIREGVGAFYGQAV